ncbi:MAG: branched-chain amino acid ABC transporter permease, partial [Treponema sp.]|nr:branched-chain amino acid ABC transporter permease [Treponema sp.]
MQERKKDKAVVLLVLLLALLLSVALEQLISPTSSMAMLLTVMKKSCVYAVVAVSMNLLNGFTGLFSLGQAGFMLLGAYTYAIFTIPLSFRPLVYRYYESAVNFSFPEVLGNAMGGFGMVLGVIIALVLAGLAAAAVAFLIGLPVLRLKSDYLAIATLGFAEVIRAVFQWGKLGPVTNGANPLKDYVRLKAFEFNIGNYTVSLSLFVLLLLAMLCIGAIVLLINSSYGR